MAINEWWVQSDSIRGAAFQSISLCSVYGVQAHIPHEALLHGKFP